MALATLDGKKVAEEREAIKAMREAANKASKQIKEQNDSLRELFTLIRKHPDLPIVAMVDSDIVAEDSCCRWLGSWGISYIDKYITHDYYGVIFYEQGRPDIVDIFEKYFDYAECGVTDEMPDKEAFKIMRAKIDTLPWVEAIIVNIDLPNEQEG